MAKDFGILSVPSMLESMTVTDLKHWEAFYYIDTGGFYKAKEKKDAPKMLRESLRHLVKKNG